MPTGAGRARQPPGARAVARDSAAGDRAGAAERARAAVQQPAGTVPLSSLPTSSWRGAQILGQDTRSGDRVSGMVERTAAYRQPRPVHRLGPQGAPAQHPSDRLQYAVSDSAVGATGAAFGFAYPGADGAPGVAGLAAVVLPPYLFIGDLRGPGTVCRDLLSGGELDGGGEDHGAG